MGGGRGVVRTFRAFNSVVLLVGMIHVTGCTAMAGGAQCEPFFGGRGRRSRWATITIRVRGVPK
eukprot:4435813-Pyramimonas_sp.AAC.1